MNFRFLTISVLENRLLNNLPFIFRGVVFVSVFVLCGFVLPNSRAEAVILFPSFDLTIVKNASGGDDNFNFNYRSYSVGNPVANYIEDFSIGTVGGAGSHFISSFAVSGDRIYLTEDSKDGWQLDGVSCESGNSAVTSELTEGGVIIHVEPFTSATCTFSNSKGGEVLDPVIIIPGILGSAEKNGEWVIDPIFHTYDDLIATLAANGYERDKTLFTFPYDWRNSNALTAVALRDKINEVKNICQCGKVDLVAHSMGGLVARYYIQSSLYNHDVDKLIFLGTPHLGAPKAYLPWEGANVPRFDPTFQVIKTLLSWDAYKLGLSFFDYIHQDVVAIGQLLPIYDYLKDSGSETLRTYPDNYPTNPFLENLNDNIANLYNSGVNITNIVGDTGTSTIGVIRVIPSPELPLWEHGRPEQFNVIISDQGLEKVTGDLTVPLFSASVFENDFNVTSSTHTNLPSETEDLIYKKLTNKDATILIKNNLTPDIIFLIKILSPADIQVIDPNGKIVGKNFDTGEEVNQVDGAFYSGFEGDDEYVTIPNPLPGDYVVKTKGTGSGSYTVATSLVSGDGSSDGKSIGTTKPGFEADVQVNIKDDNTLNIEPPDVQAVTADSVIADIEQAYSEGWISGKAVKNSLIREIKAVVKVEKKIEKIKEKVNGKNIEKRVEKFSTKVDKVLVKAIEKELQLYLNKRLINQQAYDWLKNDLELLILIY